MLDKHHDRDGRSERERPMRPADELGSLSDREVPLSPTSATVDVINRWLDGETDEPVGLRGDAARSVDFWKKVGEETDRRRRMVTPPHVPAKIMASLPPLSPQGGVAPWYKKEVKISAVVLALAALGLVVLGIVLAGGL
jgi:hypothetical protein